ncbi:MAG TPA: hypothetical protein PLJ71_21680 [Candidatus Hydrogenedentes bacterium]|nr:hypothetical protein [Candidatus Hydrogenedentota bacterium]HQM51300.1 hypothetical protein [Candidatus Hydrogenedentota bacterium]
MGSFANSIHVNCGDAAAVLDIIEKGMRDSGFEPSDEPVEVSLGFMESPVRGIDVFPSHNGWVCVLDSDLMACEAVAAELSKALVTHAMMCLVNDSDSWYFQLYNRGELVSSFNSLAGFESFEETGPALSNVVQFPGKHSQEGLEAAAKEMQQQIANAWPEELRTIQKRMENGTATEEDIQRYSDLINESASRIREEYNKFAEEFGVPPLGEGFGDSGTPNADLDTHLEALRPILPPGTSDEQVLEILGKQETFAETVLEEFLKLLGIPSHFAYLSYQYLHEDTAAEDLAKAGVQPPTELRFKPCDS